MAKRLVSVNLDEDLINEIDAISEKLCVSRSALVNLGMRGILMGETAEALGTFASAFMPSTKSKRGAKIEGKKAAKIGA